MQASGVSYSLESEIGEGNYRTLLVTTSEDFFNPEGSSEESLGALSLSFDQELGDLLGVWISSDGPAMMQQYIGKAFTPVGST